MFTLPADIITDKSRVPHQDHLMNVVEERQAAKE